MKYFLDNMFRCVFFFLNSLYIFLITSIINHTFMSQFASVASSVVRLNNIIILRD